jgi:hypothetical protein
VVVVSSFDARMQETRTSLKIEDDIPIVPSIAHALHWLASPDRLAKVGKIFILGGAAGGVCVFVLLFVCLSVFVRSVQRGPAYARCDID